MMTCSELLEMYQLHRPEPEIHQAFREVALDDRDGLPVNSTPLHIACRYADDVAVGILVGRGADVNIKDNDGNTPLYLLGGYGGGGVKRDRQEKIRKAASLLLDNGADVHRSAKRTTALIEAVYCRNFGVAEVIVDSGCRVDSTDPNGENVLHVACSTAGRILKDILFSERRLADHTLYGIKPEQIKMEIDELRKQEGELLDIVRKLLAIGSIDPEDRNICGKTVMDIAVETGAVKMAALLLGGEADGILWQTGGMDIFQAMYHKHLHVVEALLQSGIELQTVCEYSKMYDFYGKSPLSCAFVWFEELPGVAEMILDAGADPNWRSPDEETAFAALLSRCLGTQKTTEDRLADILKKMRSKGWDIEQPVDREGNASLALACRQSAYTSGEVALRFLLEEGADVNAANRYGQTPCMILYGGHPEYKGVFRYVQGEHLADNLEMLLEAGADSGKRDDYGNNLLHYIAAGCLDYDLKRTMDILKDFGLPDSDVANNDGKTAMDMAVGRHNEAMVNLLLKYT